MRLRKHIGYHIANTGTQLITGILLARALKPEGLGELSLLQSYCFLITPLTQFSTKANLLTALEKSNIQAAASNILTFWGSLLGFLCLLPLCILTPHLQTIAPLCFLLFCLSEGLEKKASKILLLKENLLPQISWQHKTQLLSSALKILCAYTLPLPLAIPALFGCQTIQSLMQRKWGEKQIKKLPELPKLPEPSWEDLIDLAKASLLPLPSQILGQLCKSSGPILLMQFYGLGALGLYAAALKHGTLFSISQQLLYERHLNKQSTNLAIKYSLGTLAVAIPTLPLLSLLYGNNYPNIGWVAGLLIPSHMLSLLGAGQTQTLYNSVDQKKIPLVSSIAHILTLIANLTLIPLGGIVGIITATTLGGALQWLLGARLLKQHKRQL